MPKFHQVSISKSNWSSHHPTHPSLTQQKWTTSAFKVGVKSDLALPEWQLRVGNREAARDAGMNRQQWRSDLQDVTQEHVGQITHEKCIRWYNHNQTYMARFLACLEIEGWRKQFKKNRKSRREPVERNAQGNVCVSFYKDDPFRIRRLCFHICIFFIS